MPVCEFDYGQMELIKDGLRLLKDPKIEEAKQNAFDKKYGIAFVEMIDEIMKMIDKEQNIFGTVKL